MPRAAKPPRACRLPRVGELVSYLREASSNGVRFVEVSRLNEAANLERELQALLHRLVECHAEAALCRLVLELKDAPLRGDDLCPGLLLLGPGGGGSHLL